jgi:hypothetical protein
VRRKKRRSCLPEVPIFSCAGSMICGREGRREFLNGGWFGQSRRTTLRRELLIFRPPLYSMNPSFLNLFMK